MLINTIVDTQILSNQTLGNICNRLYLTFTEIRFCCKLQQFVARITSDYDTNTREKNKGKHKEMKLSVRHKIWT